MERMQGTESTIEIFENDIDQALHMFCESHEPPIDDLCKASQSIWNACLMYIKRHVFNVPGLLKINKPLDGYVNNNSGISQSNCNAYDIDKVNVVCDYYIYLCMVY
jgi:hypothetical protein